MARSNQMPRGNSGVVISNGFTAEHFGGEAGVWRTVLTATSATMPAIAGGAALGVGRLAMTFPAGVKIISGSAISLGLTQTQGFVNANTPVLGLGTVVASGAVSVLSGTATFQNIMAGSAVANCTGTQLVNQVNTGLVIPAADAGTVHVNTAGTWAANGDTGLLIRGFAVIMWTELT